MGTGNTRNHSHCLDREQKIQETILVVWDGNGKTLIGTEMENFKVIQKYIFFIRDFDILENIAFKIVRGDIK